MIRKIIDDGTRKPSMLPNAGDKNTSFGACQPIKPTEPTRPDEKILMVDDGEKRPIGSKLNYFA